MDREPLHRLLRSLHARAGEPPGCLSDAQLLQRFVDSRDEAAFELLLWRHGPAVLGVCRRLLSDPHDAEDAFQATFLILMRKAGGIARREALGSWLYRVAYRVALRARVARAKRTADCQVDVDHLAAPAGGDPDWRELREVLDEEVNRLPARHRDVFVLCCVQGKTGEEAARQLGCPAGTVSSRLTRARERLRQRLSRRGLDLALAGPPSAELLSPTLPAKLVAPTVQAVLVYSSRHAAGGVLSARAVAHAEGVLRAMFLTRMKIAALLVLMVGFLAAGGLVTLQALEAPPRATTQVAEDAPEKLVVSAVKPQTGGLGRGKITQTCTLQAFERVDVHAVVAGVLAKQDVDLGSRVKKGQVLAWVDAPLLRLAEKQAAAAVRQAEGLVRESQARLAAARTEVQASKSVIVQRQSELDGARAAQDHKQRVLDRIQRLNAARAVGQDELDSQKALSLAAKSQTSAATAAVATAQADLELKQSKVTQAEAALMTAKANVEAAEVELEKARYSLGLTRVLAPFDGVVTLCNYQNGHQLRDGGSRLPLYTVQRTDRMRVVAEVAELDALRVEPGAAVELTVAALPGVRIEGLTISRVGFAVDPKTRSMRVEIDVPNTKQQLRPGMFGSATIELKQAEGALRLPSSCLIPLPGATFAVYVIRDGKAYRTPVRVGTRTAREVEVLSDLKPTDLVVADARGLKGEIVAVEVKEKPGS